MRKHLCLISGLVLFAAIFISLEAQDRTRFRDRIKKDLGNPPPVQPTRIRNDLIGQSFVFIAEEKTVAEEFEKAAAYEKGAQWDTAVDIYQDLVLKYPDRMVRRNDRLYAGVKTAVEEILRSEPSERLKAYRETFDLVARRYLETALRENNYVMLTQIARKFSLTSVGEEVLNLAGDLAYEDGRFEEAYYYWGKLVRLYPESNRVVSLVPKFMLVARKAPGNTHVIGTLAKIASEKKLGSAVVMINGKKHVLDEYLKDSLNSLPKSLAGGYRSYRDYFYPRPEEMTLEVRRWHWAIPPEYTRGEATNSFKYGAATLRWNALLAPALPAVEDRLIAYRYHDTLWLLQPLTGGVLRNHLVQSGLGSDWTLGLFQNVTLRNGTVYTPMWRDKSGIQYDQVRYPIQNFFSYDADADRGTWFQGGPQWNIRTAPEATDEHLYAIAEYRDLPTSVPAYYVVCLSRETGRIEWTSFLCANHGGIDFIGKQVNDPSQQILSIYGDTIYVASNAGLVAALEMGSGDVKWVHLYSSLPGAQSTNLILTPPLFDRGRVVVFPVDSQQVLGLDAATGELKWSFELKQKGKCEGIVGGKVVITDNQKVAFLDVEDGKAVGEWAPPEGNDLAPAGKGALSRTTVYLPTAKGVWAVPVQDVKKGTLVAWPEAQAAGTILLLPDGTLSVSAGGMSMFVTREKMDEIKRKKQK